MDQWLQAVSGAYTELSISMPHRRWAVRQWVKFAETVRAARLAGLTDALCLVWVKDATDTWQALLTPFRAGDALMDKTRDSALPVICLDTFEQYLRSQQRTGTSATKGTRARPVIKTEPNRRGPASGTKRKPVLRPPIRVRYDSDTYDTNKNCAAVFSYGRACKGTCHKNHNEAGLKRAFPGLKEWDGRPRR